jgi:hypothetical protein
MKQRWIYALKLNNEIVYVGETGDPKERFKHHRTRSISKFKGLPIEMHILEESSESRQESHFLQRKWQEIFGLEPDNRKNQVLRSKSGGIQSGISRSLHGTRHQPR